MTRTHHGQMFGVPVWLDMTDPECPSIEPKYGLLGECAWQTMNALFGCFTWLNMVINPDYDPLFPIRVGKPV